MGITKQQRANVLVVDDEPEIVEIFSDVLSSKGFKLYTADGVAAALRILATESIEIVISDINMGARSGIDLLIEAKASTSHRPFFVMITGNEGIPLDTVINAGAYALFSKPVRMETLLETLGGIEKLIEGTRRAERFEIEFSATNPEGTSVWTLKNVSRGGALISGVDLPATGSLMRVVLKEVGESYGQIMLEGAVRWASGSYIGVEWIKSASTAIGGDLRFWNDLHTRIFRRSDQS